MIPVSPTVAPSWLRRFLEKPKLSDWGFPFSRPLTSRGFDCFNEPRSLFAVWEGQRRTRVGRHGTAGESLRVAGRRKKNGKSL